MTINTFTMLILLSQLDRLLTVPEGLYGMEFNPVLPLFLAMLVEVEIGLIFIVFLVSLLIILLINSSVLDFRLKPSVLEKTLRKKIKKSKVIVVGGDTAILLQYERGKVPLPLILAKLKGEIALKIVQFAKKEGVPVMEEAGLVSVLHEDGIIDQFIPDSVIRKTASLIDAVDVYEQG